MEEFFRLLENAGILKKVLRMEVKYYFIPCGIKLCYRVSDSMLFSICRTYGLRLGCSRLRYTEPLNGLMSKPTSSRPAA